MDSFLVKRAASVLVTWSVGCGAFLLVATRPGFAFGSPTLTTEASSPVLAGGSLSDTAVLSGGLSPTGTLTFYLQSPNDCQGTAIFISTKTVAGNGTYTSDPFSPVAASTTYAWDVIYSGDANNSSAAEGCGNSEKVTEPQYCPPKPQCAPATNVCGGNGLFANVTSTTSCTGSAARVTVTQRTLLGPGEICFGPEQSVGCRLLFAGRAIETNTETVSVSPPTIPTLAVWGLGALVAVLGAVALRRLRPRQG